MFLKLSNVTFMSVRNLTMGVFLYCQYMKGRLQAIEPHEESNVCNAFDKAFDALARVRYWPIWNGL